MEQLLTSGWEWPPSVLCGCAALLLVYWAALGGHCGRHAWQSFLFVTGVLILLLALVSPLDMLGDTYLLSAHMLQHLLLVLVVPPLLLLGIPAWLARRALRWPPAQTGERILGNPAVAWSVATATMVCWHIPALYDAALANQRVHIVQHLSFLATATIFWWPVVTPLAERRMAAPLTILYLFSACLASSMLGIIIAFAPSGLYPPYLQPHDTYTLLPLLRGQWGISPAVDQQVGGLIMWVVCCLVYLSAIMLSLAHWYSTPEAETEIASPPFGGREEIPAIATSLEQS